MKELLDLMKNFSLKFHQVFIDISKYMYQEQTTV